MTEKNVGDVLQFAIEKEILSYEFYIKAIDSTIFRRNKEKFMELANEEEEHRKLLENLRNDKIASGGIDVTFDFNFENCFDDIENLPHMDYADILQMGLKIEDCSVKLYNYLAESSKDDDLKKTFAFLAQEESIHKLRFEEEEFNK